MNLGLAFYKADQLGDAIDAFTRVLAAEPDNVRARYLAADCQLRLGKPAEAIALLTPIEAAHADDPALAYLLGMAYLKAKDVDRGQVLLDRILRRGDSAQARVMMGVAKRGAGDLKAAVEDLKQAVALDPDLPGVHAMYAQALLEAGNPDIARAEFEAELSRNPLDFETNLNLAVHHFTRALGVRPGDLATRFQIASVSLARRDVQAAAGMLEAIIAEAPSFLEAHVALATAYYRLQRKGDGDRERAIVDRLTREREAKEQARTGRVKPGG
jgi:predicted Zn-dependent protease